MDQACTFPNLIPIWICISTAALLNFLMESAMASCVSSESKLKSSISHISCDNLISLNNQFHLICTRICTYSRLYITLSIRLSFQFVQQSFPNLMASLLEIPLNPRPYPSLVRSHIDSITHDRPTAEQESYALNYPF